jgi:hypothetical protein
MRAISRTKNARRQEARGNKGQGGEGGVAVAAYDKQLGSCTSGKRKYAALLYVCSVVISGAATLPQQKNNNKEDLQWSRVSLPALSAQWQGNPRGDVPSASSMRCCTKPRRRPLPGANRTIFHAVNRHKRKVAKSVTSPAAKISVWAFSDPPGGSRVAACFVRWRALPLRGPPRGQQQHFSMTAQD